MGKKGQILLDAHAQNWNIANKDKKISNHTHYCTKQDLGTSEGWFTRYDFDACDKFTTGLWNESIVSCKSNLQLSYYCCVPQKNCRGILKHVSFKTLRQS